MDHSITQFSGAMLAAVLRNAEPDGRAARTLRRADGIGFARGDGLDPPAVLRR
jgi:hypothetical protein